MTNKKEESLLPPDNIGNQMPSQANDECVPDTNGNSNEVVDDIFADIEKTGRERRSFIRIPFQKNINYSVCYKGQQFAETVEGSTENISQEGILFKTKWPPAIYSMISLNIDPKKFKEHVDKDPELKKIFNLDRLYAKKGKFYGEVVRIREYPESGYYDVAVRLILKK